MVTDVNFNLQQFLSEMRAEMLTGFDRLDATAIQVRQDLVEHEMADLQVGAEVNRKLDEISRFRASVLWTIRTIVAALIVAGVGFLFTLLP